MFAAALAFLPLLATSNASPLLSSKRWVYEQYFDVQAHRGGRGESSENVLPAFAQAIYHGVTTLELDCGLTRDGEAIVWHDEDFVGSKCRDTKPAFPNDPQYPYVGQYVANLTLAQIKTLDCGSLRQEDFPLQEVYPGNKVSTLQEMFDFVKCATDEPILFNIESKIDADYRNLTRTPEDFVKAIGDIVTAQGEDVVDRVTHQSFDWRALLLSKKSYPALRTSALCDDTTLYRSFDGGEWGNLTTHTNEPSNWLAGIDIDSFEGRTLSERVAQAAHSIEADILSPVATSFASVAQSPSEDGWIPFTNATMVDAAHELGMKVKPWTPESKSLLSYLLDLGVDGVITDYPHEFLRHLETFQYDMPSKGDWGRIEGCLNKYNQYTEDKLDGRGYDH